MALNQRQHVNTNEANTHTIGVNAPRPRVMVTYEELNHKILIEFVHEIEDVQIILITKPV